MPAYFWLVYLTVLSPFLILWIESPEGVALRSDLRQVWQGLTWVQVFKAALALALIATVPILVGAIVQDMVRIRHLQMPIEPGAGAETKPQP